MNLSTPEIRVLGCLLEKQRTTPDQYPLTLNALRLACNQSTNRDPVVDYDDAVLRDALHRLDRRGYTRLASGAGSRAPKYRHLLAEALPMHEDEQAVMCVLMLRGPQTPGELKQRADRMHQFADLGSVHATLERLIGRDLVTCLGRRPGQKEDRYAQLLEDADAQGPGAATVAGTGSALPGVSQPGSFASSPLAPAGITRSPVVAHEEGLADLVTSAAFRELEERVARLERELQEVRATRGVSDESGGEGEQVRPGEYGEREAEEAPTGDPEHAGSLPTPPNGFSDS
ncbi:MAG TPA: YceH family protein [Solirubrobacteraceae bacterium]|jgi:hypothetical protein